ncbi:hypothetical protein WJX77_008287 [Trebouxia sp. C0004]
MTSACGPPSLFGGISSTRLHDLASSGPQVAKEMQHITCKLPRMVVPQTAEGCTILVSSKRALQPLEKKLRPQAQPAIRLMASSDTFKGYEQVIKGVTQDAAPASTEHHSAGLDSEPELSHAQVWLTGSLLGNGQYGQTLLAS